MNSSSSSTKNTMREFRDFKEVYESSTIGYDSVGVDHGVEPYDPQFDSMRWGSALSLSMTDTLEYCNAKNRTLPSAGLLVSLFKETLKDTSEPVVGSLTEDFTNYWLRANTVLVFPRHEKDQATKGYVVHYLELDRGSLARENGRLKGKVTIELNSSDFPEPGTTPTFRDKKSKRLFDALLGVDVAERFADVVEKEYGFTPCMWVPPKVAQDFSPERLVIAGGLKQYGQGLWLTSNCSNKAVVGTRPFRTCVVSEPRLL